MLTKRQNLLQTIKPDGKPDRYVNQYEAYNFMMGNPLTARGPKLKNDGVPIVDSWGVTKVWPQGAPGPFPVHDDEHIVMKDIEDWKQYVKAPDFHFSDCAWEPFIEIAQSTNRDEQFVMVCIAPGLFEQTHYLCEIKNTLLYLATNPDEIHEMIKYFTQFELLEAEAYCHYIKPDAILHHDDWGMQANTFMSPEMFHEFFFEPYQEIYGYYKTHGVEVIVHHSDSYAATLVPDMIDMGIDIWQGVLDTNDIPELIRKYGGRISFHGGLNNGIYDVENYSGEAIADGLKKLMSAAPDGKFLIPGLCCGGPGACYPGVYECVSEEIDKLNKDVFGSQQQSD